VIELVSADSLRKTGIFPDKGGDFRRFSPPGRQKREAGDRSECAKRRDIRPILTSLGKPGQTREWVAGAGGIEPPNGGIKIRCLTAWLRPNNPERQRPRSPATPVYRGSPAISTGWRLDFCPNRARQGDTLYKGVIPGTPGRSSRLGEGAARYRPSEC
jgi:hypothetical protein